MHACAGASIGGLKAMTATSEALMHDAYGWALTNEIPLPLVVVDAMPVGPISGASRSHSRASGTTTAPA